MKEAHWQTDILGEPFQAATLRLKPDSEGPVVATLVRSLASAEQPALPLTDVDVLYLHGWSDYFFQTDLAHFWNSLGANFYALDLRKYGRSLRMGQTPGYVDDLSIYDEDIGAALSQMETTKNGRRLVLLGHSTGGLTLALWAARHRNAAAALILNSPWLEFQTGAISRHAITPLVKAHTLVNPKTAYPEVDFGYYTKAQEKLGVLPKSGYRRDWRPARGFTTRPGWLNAIFSAQERFEQGVTLGCNALVLLSAQSTLPLTWNDEMTHSDSVLTVADIATSATRIHPDVSIRRIPGALHDVFLSAEPARSKAYTSLRRWLLQGELADRKQPARTD